MPNYYRDFEAVSQDFTAVFGTRRTSFDCSKYKLHRNFRRHRVGDRVITRPNYLR
jgi:hypothetical protein